jgi:Asp-tRNA(Asn)/Glu-tRNA(Gln) amidotransferase A subunit family amidase
MGLFRTKTNCLTEIFVDSALARAAEVDEHLKTTGTVMGPLHGLPVSLKDQVAIKGLETVMGASAWTECVMLLLILAQGTHLGLGK